MQKKLRADPPAADWQLYNFVPLPSLSFVVINLIDNFQVGVFKNQGLHLPGVELDNDLWTCPRGDDLLDAAHAEVGVADQLVQVKLDTRLAVQIGVR